MNAIYMSELAQQYFPNSTPQALRHNYTGGLY